MQWFLDLSMRAKLLVSFGLVIAMMALMTATAVVAISRVQDAQHEVMSRDFVTATKLLEIRSLENRQRARFLSLSLKTTRAEQDQVESDIRAQSARMDALIASLVALRQDDGRFFARVGELKLAIEAYRRVREQQIALIHDGKVALSQALSAGEQDKRYETIIAIATELGKEASARAEAAAEASEDLASSALALITVLGLLTLAIAIATGSYLHRVIVGPLQDVSGAARRIASGDLAVQLDRAKRADELGALAGTFSDMSSGLRAMVADLREGIGVLAAAASEITASTTQVAAGSSEAAVAVSQTSATVEEVKQTAHVAAQKARHVSDTAHKSAQISQDGRRAADQSMEGIRRIQQQMERIAGSIVRLSEQGRAIGDIIATVNDLAEQSNLLAVNAAIEAAKAGDQGKGFAVVAQEIKSLAEQSKRATAQVRSILGDIQRATDEAVLATEQGGKAVDAGAQLSTQLGDSIRMLAESITDASLAATQIAASAQQQLAGMDQVALAMQNINQASSQNVASTRQAEAAAQNLHELGQKLRQLVERYAV